MEHIYLLCLLISLGMLLWLKLYDVRNSIIQFANLLIVVIANLGYYLLSTSTTVKEAIVAQKVTYVGGVFLPAFFLLLVLEICHIEIQRYISFILLSLQCIVYAFVCTIGRSEIFYKSVDIVIKDGTAVLIKEYGPLHNLYLLTMYVYLILGIIITVYSFIKKNTMNRRGVLVMIILSVLAIVTYVVQKLLHLEYDFIPIAYIALMLGSLFPVYKSNLFTVYENKEIIDEQLGNIGFLTFDTNKVYMDNNEMMASIFPELNNYRAGQKLSGCSSKLQEMIDQISELEAIIKASPDKEHVHVTIDSFWLNDKNYKGMIHIVTNPFKKLKGFTIELRDNTANQQIIELKEHYNDELSKEVAAKTKKIRTIQQKTILGMAQMVESRDLSTGGHIKRTSDVVRIFAKKLKNENMGLDYSFLRLVIRSAPMHDIGKIGVDDAILRKQGRFTDNEYNAMKKHSEIGARMVREILSGVEEPDFVRVAENVAHYHHEKVNGTGYPAGLKGEEIPIEARIMALADVFDALVSKRCYKEAFSYDRAFEIIKNDAGSHFDEKLAALFIECRPELEEYYNKSIE